MTTLTDPPAGSAGGGPAPSSSAPPDPPARPAGGPDSPSGPISTADRFSRRMHLLAVSVALIVLTFVQAPGRIAPDTKADLSIDPVHFLLRAAHLWDPLGDSGQLQNQAYGYFLPMGPFYAVGHLLHLPAWMVQRAWWAFVLLVAFHGLYRLCERFGVGTHPIQIVAALTFALSSRMITELGSVSIEVWPVAMAPWVLLPLIKVRPGGESGAAARSGLAIAFCGGVNAVAVGAVLPLPVLWLITRERGKVRRKLSAWWALAVGFGCFWWLGPLLLLGRFSPPFLDWVESAQVSTSKAGLPSAFRGTTQWVAWLKEPEPIRLAGWSVLSSPVGILLGWLLITIAVLGLLRRDTPNRRFLIGGCLVGLVLLTTGHVGPLTPPWAPDIQALLDGVGAPLRNTHKFDVVLRVPLTLALAHALAKVRVPTIAFSGLRPLSGQRMLFLVVSFALVGSAAPALVGQLPSAGTFTKVPDPWQQAATWLKQNDDGARTLIVPGSSFATSVWGDPHDEPFQALARTPWATRSAVPLSSAGNIRVLNTIEQQLETGRGSAGLAEYLARAGISRVLLRSDLVRAFEPGSPPLPVTVRAALQDSPGLHPVARFGPKLQGVRDIFKVADDGLDVPQSQIEIWQVDSPTRLAEVERAPDALRVAGGPESLLSLAEAGRLGARPVVLDGDPEAKALQSAPLVVTDTIQRREANIAQVRDNYSQPLTATEPYRRKRKVYDWLPFAAPEVVAQYEGISGVRASSEAGSSAGAWQAVDGDPSTSWTSSVYAVGQWLEVTFPKPVSLPASIQLSPAPASARLAQVRIDTDTGSEYSSITQGTDQTGSPPQQIAVPGGTTRRLRLTVTKVWSGQELGAVSIADLALPGITVQRQLVLPRANGSGAPETIDLQSARDGVDGCVFSDGRAVCSPRLQKQSEDSDLDRVAQLPVGGRYDVEATARVKATPEADALLQAKGSMTATSSSRRGNDPALRPDAAIDRDPGTAWLASSTDPKPSLTLSWPEKRTISRLRWQIDPSLAASRPSQLQIVTGSKRQTVTPDAQGWVSFTPVQTKQVKVVVTRIQALQTLDRASGFSTVLPIGASEIVIPGSDSFRRPFGGYQRVRSTCGSGPELTIAGKVVRTRLSGVRDDVLHRRPMPVVPCDPVPDLPAGAVRLEMHATSLLEPEQLIFRLHDAQTPVPPATTMPVSIVQKDSEHRTVTVNRADVDQVLIVHENANPGWQATINGRRLSTVRIDGWQQGWIVPAGMGGAIQLVYTPGQSYRLALGIGLFMIVLLAVFATVDRRSRRRRRRRQRAAAEVQATAAFVAAATLGTEPEFAPPVARPTAGTGGRIVGAGPVGDDRPVGDAGPVGEAGPADPIPLPEAPSTRLDALLAVVSIVLLGGLWGLVALLGVLYAGRLRVPMRMLVAGFAGLAGVGAAFSLNADESGFFGTLSIASSLALVACMVVRMDAVGGRLLARAVQKLPARPGGSRLLAAGRRAWNATGPAGASGSNGSGGSAGSGGPAGSGGSAGPSEPAGPT